MTIKEKLLRQKDFTENNYYKWLNRFGNHAERTEYFKRQIKKFYNLLKQYR